VESVVTVTSDHDGAVTFTPLGDLRPYAVRETRRHVGNGKRESVLEVMGNSALLERATVKILGDRVLEDTVGTVVLLVVVHKELFSTITVDVNILSKVDIKDSRVINNTAGNERTINGRDSVDRKDLIEELSTENDDLVLVLGHFDHIDTNISHVTKNVLSPVFGLKTTFGVFEPEEFTLTSLGVGASSKEILAAITVKINPETHVMEVALLLGESVSVEGVGLIIGIDLNNVNTTVALAWDEETIGNDDGTLAREHIGGNNLDFVGPFKARSVELENVSIFNIVVLDVVSDIGNNINVTTAQSTEAGDDKEVIGVIELTHFRESSIFDVEFTHRSNIVLSSGIITTPPSRSSGSQRSESKCSFHFLG